jgi:nucleoside-diphosphate-sugar epimerase
MMVTERFLVTGALGCLGAWVTKLLLDEGVDVATFDLSTDDRRLRQIIDPDGLDRIERIVGDITDRAQVADAFEGRSHVVHLAALQVPFCKANPPLGAAVNVTGTINVFEAVKDRGIEHLAYASSVAVYGHPSRYDVDVVPPDAPRLPETLYGVFKVANEDSAGVYWQDHQVPSIGLRPYTIYGPLRDQGLTSQPTLAIEAAVRDERYNIEYGGVSSYQFAPDVARLFIMSARAEPSGADVYSLRGDIVPMDEFVGAINDVTGAAGVTHGDRGLPFPSGADDGPLRERFGDVPHTLLREAIAITAEFFRERERDGTS